MKNETNKTEEKVYTAGEVGSMLESIDNTMKMMAENHVGVIERLDGIDNRLNNVENRLERVEGKVDRLQDDMVEVKFELKRKVDQDDFKKLEKRVIKLERLSPAR